MSAPGDSRLCRLATTRIILADPGLHGSRCGGVGCFGSPQSLIDVSSWGFAPLPPCHNANYFGGSRPSRFALWRRWLLLLTPVTDRYPLLGIRAFAAVRLIQSDRGHFFCGRISRQSPLAA